MGKSKIEKVKQNELRRKKYAAVLNAWGSVELAARARSWSDERIRDELGVNLPKSMPKKRKQSAETLKRKQREYDNFVYIREVNRTQYDSVVSVNNLIKLVKRGYGKKRLHKTIVDDVDETVKSKITPVETKPVVPDRVTRLQIKNERIKQWVEWSKSKELPYNLVQLAERVNKLKGEDNDSKVGYIVVYNAYINQQSIEIWLDKIKFIGFVPEQYIIT